MIDEDERGMTFDDHSKMLVRYEDVFFASCMGIRMMLMMKMNYP
jgi:hypothetical protein